MREAEHALDNLDHLAELIRDGEITSKDPLVVEQMLTRIAAARKEMERLNLGFAIPYPEDEEDGNQLEQLKMLTDLRTFGKLLDTAIANRKLHELIPLRDLLAQIKNLYGRFQRKE